MKKQAFLGMSLVAATLVFMGCSNDNGPAALENLKPVQFNAVADKVISSEPTEDVSGGKRILRQVVRKQMTLAPVQFGYGRPVGGNLPRMRIARRPFYGGRLYASSHHQPTAH